MSCAMSMFYNPSAWVLQLQLPFNPLGSVHLSLRVDPMGKLPKKFVGSLASGFAPVARRQPKMSGWTYRRLCPAKLAVWKGVTPSLC